MWRLLILFLPALVTCVRADARAPLNQSVELHVPGALRLAVYCGGDTTVHQQGPRATFVPEGPRCRVDAPLSPVMPVRGELELTSARRYTCGRDGVMLACRPD